MNKWQQIWERRRDNLQHIDTSDPRAVFAELIRLDGYDSAGLTSELVDYMAHQYEDLKAALNTVGGCLKLVAAQAHGFTCLPETATLSAAWIIPPR